MAKASTTASWPASKIEMRATGTLTPYVHNARLHPEHQIEKLMQSITEYGFTNPILIDEQGGVIAGHGRLQAAERLKINKVPCMVAVGWSENQKRAYVIADNRFAELATWDMDVLLAEANALLASGFNLDLAGIDESFLSKTLNGFNPELAPVATSKPVTDTEVAKTQAGLDKQYESAGQAKMLAVICPDCGHEFDVSGE